jgi:hypothetical protein
MTSDYTRKVCDNCIEWPHHVCEHHQLIEELEMISKYLYEISEKL